MTNFPRTMVGGMSLPRMLIGSNWLMGYSHKTKTLDDFIKRTNSNRDGVATIVKAFLAHGIDAYMGGVGGNQVVIDGLKKAEDDTGKRVIRIDTPAINVDDNAAGRAEALNTIKQSKAAGSDFCFPHHMSVEQLMNKNLKAIPRLPDYLSMIRDNGMIPGLSAHMPECIIFSDLNEYDVETYIQIYNCLGFLMQVEIEYIHNVIWNAKKPVMTIKPMAAGRCTPLVGISFSFATLRPCDMVTVGCMLPEEAEEDIEIGLAAIERRRPVFAGRASFSKSAVMQEQQ